MKTTIPKLRRILREVIKESFDSQQDQEHLSGLEKWIFQSTEEGMEESYEDTIESYMDACEEDGNPISKEKAEDYLEELLYPSNPEVEAVIEMEGDLVVHLDAEREDEDYEDSEEE